MPAGACGRVVINTHKDPLPMTGELLAPSYLVKVPTLRAAGAMWHPGGTLPRV